MILCVNSESLFYKYIIQLGIAKAKCHLLPGRMKQSQKDSFVKIISNKKNGHPKNQKQLQGKLIGTGLVKRSYGSFS